MKPTKEMIDRFLTWPVPADVCPDGTPGQPGRTGTNLLSAPQTEQMLAHVLSGMVVSAKPPEWAECKRTGRDRQWDDSRHGFNIAFDPDGEEGARYQATWGEGPEDCFPTLEDAQQWCQNTIDEWVRDNVLMAPNASFRGGPEARPAGNNS